MSNPQMSAFIASRDLSPEDFAIFSRQYRNSLEASRRRLRSARAEIARNEAWIKSDVEEINRTKRAMLEHGIEP